MNLQNNQSGFTLLELIVSISIIVVISGIAMGGMRLGISARDAGEKKADLYQRLRFIGEQVSEKIKSAHPYFVKTIDPESIETNEVSAQSANQKEIPKLLIFEGLPNSIRLITFSNALSMLRNPSWMHDVYIYLGTNPETNEEGIIMVERKVSAKEVSSEFNPDDPGTRFITLAENVAFLSFNYYKMEKLTPEEILQQEDQSLQHKGAWTDTIQVKSFEQEIETLFFEDESKLSFYKKNRISMPRAIEVSIGLQESPFHNTNDESKIVYLPPTIFTFNAGVEFIRPPLELEINAEN